MTKSLFFPQSHDEVIVITTNYSRLFFRRLPITIIIIIITN